MYFDPDGTYPTEYEMYDLANDPLEITNLAHGQTSFIYQAERARLQSALTLLMQQTGTLPSQYVSPTDG